MALKTPGSRRGREPLRIQRSGHVLVVSRETVDPVLLGQTAARAAEAGHSLVAVAESACEPSSDFDAVLAELPAAPSILRLIPLQETRTSTLALGAWLAKRAHRPVLAYEGSARSTADGCLFIAAGAGAGWSRFAPGGPQERYSRRFPTPRWESEAFDSVRDLTAGVLVEPLPAGAWIRPVGGSHDRREHRLRVREVAFDALRPVVAVGCPGSRPVSVPAVAEFFQGLPEGHRRAVRFVVFGATTVPGEAFGQALADAVGAAVSVAVWERGLTVGDAARGYFPASAGEPGAGSAATEPGLPVAPAEPAGAAARSAGEPEPADVAPEAPEAPPESAAGLALPLVQLVSGPADLGEVPSARSGTREPVHRPAPDDRRTRMQPVPTPDASALIPVGGIARERVWLRRNLADHYDAAASITGRALSENPGLRSGGDLADALADLVAVRLYLTGDTRSLDDAVRSAVPGRHIPLARCVAAGIDRLPSHRGPTRVRVDLDDADRRWYTAQSVITEWSCWPVLTSGRFRLPGKVEFLVWSMTARSTALIQPELPDQAVFPAGTSFRVLRDAEGGDRHRILMRELAPGETASDGTVIASQAFDEIAVSALTAVARVWAEGGSQELPTEWRDRFGSAPGLLAAADASGGGPGGGGGRGAGRPALEALR